MDTTGSMFEEITAARLRAHSIIQSRARSSGEPSSYVLVPFHDPSESHLLIVTIRNLEHFTPFIGFQTVVL